MEEGNKHVFVPTYNFFSNSKFFVDHEYIQAHSYKLLDTFLFMKVLPEQDCRMSELYSSRLEVNSKIIAKLF